MICCWSWSQGIISALDINEFIQKDILVTIRVTLCIHSFGNGIGHEGGDFAIGKFNVKDPRVKNGIVMGMPNDVSLSIALAAD